MAKIDRSGTGNKVVDTSGNDLGPSTEFMLADLAKSGLTPKDIKVQPLPLEADGTRSYRILYPREGVYRTRRDGDPKYIGSPGHTDAYLVDVSHFAVMQERRGVVYIVEGEKKAAAFWKYIKRYVAGIGGCWNFRAKDMNPLEMIAELRVIVQGAERIVLVLDGDIVDNDDVARAARQFHACCELLGVECEIVELPRAAEHEKRLGLDDWILAQGEMTTAQLRAQFDDLPRVDPKTLPESKKLIAHRLKLAMRKSGENEIIAPTVDNALKLVGDVIGDRASTDEFLGEIIDDEPYQDYHDTEIQIRIERLLGASNPWPMQLTKMARQSLLPRWKTNRLADWLRGLKWDGKKRVATMFADLFGAKDHSAEYLEDAARAFLVGMCARAVEPGCKFDLMLILQGPQGIGKTIALEALAGTLMGRRLVSTADLGSDPNELGRIIEESWIVSFDEMAGHSRRDDAMLKNLLTQTERVRNVKYAEKVKRALTHCVFAGTTNEWQPLRDVTGNRRFLVVRCGKIDVARIAKLREQLLAEAMTHISDASWWRVRNASEEQEAARLAHPWEEPLDQYLAHGEMMRGAKGTIYAGKRITTSHALLAAVRASVSGDGRPVEANAATVARSAFARGWRKVKMRRSGLELDGSRSTLFWPAQNADDGSLEVVVPELVWVYVEPA